MPILSVSIIFCHPCYHALSTYLDGGSSSWRRMRPIIPMSPRVNCTRRSSVSCSVCLLMRFTRRRTMTRHGARLSLAAVGALRRQCCQSILLISVREKEKHINIKNFWGLSPALGGWPKFVYMCFFGVMPYGGKTHKQNPQKIPGQSREISVYMFFFLGGFSSLPRASRRTIQRKFL